MFQLKVFQVFLWRNQNCGGLICQIFLTKMWLLQGKNLNLLPSAGRYVNMTLRDAS